MNKELSTNIKTFLNSSSYANQIIGVNLALQNGYAVEEIALYVLNNATGWESRISKPSRDRITIRWRKSFLRKYIAIKGHLYIEEPFRTELYIHLNKEARGLIVFQYRDFKPNYNEKTARRMLDGLIKLIGSEIFVES